MIGDENLPVRDGGMQAYLGVNGGQPPAAAVAAANPDNYFLIPGKTFSASIPPLFGGFAGAYNTNCK